MVSIQLLREDLGVWTAARIEIPGLAQNVVYLGMGRGWGESREAGRGLRAFVEELSVWECGVRASERGWTGSWTSSVVKMLN